MKYRGFSIRFRTAGCGRMTFAYRFPDGDDWHEWDGSYSTRDRAEQAAKRTIDLTIECCPKVVSS